MSLRDCIARALYDHWVEEDFSNEYAGWDLLAGKEQWLERADAVIAAIQCHARESPTNSALSGA